MDIESKSLTACDVTPDGSEILLGFVDTDGKSATIRLPLNQAGTLAMTLPELINKALRSRSKPALRLSARVLGGRTVV